MKRKTAYVKTFTTAFFCRRKTNIGRHLRRHCRMPPPIPMAGETSPYENAVVRIAER